MNKTQLETKVKELGTKQPWNHNFLLTFDIETRPGKQVSHGKNLVKWERIEPLLKTMNLRNKKVLDVGCNEGFFSHKLDEMGSSVTGIDVDALRIEKAIFVIEILRKKSIKFSVMDIYSKDFSKLPRFDFCLCMGFLHRIPDPFTAVSKLAEHTNIILFEWKALKFGDHHLPFAYYTPGDFDNADYYGTQYWLLSFSCVEEILKRLGFTKFHRIDDPYFKRAILVAGKVDNPVFEKPDMIIRRNRFRTFLSHTKRYLKTIKGICSGEVNF